MPQVLKAGGVWVKEQRLTILLSSPGDAEPPHSLCDHLQSVLQMNFVCFNISGWTLTLLYSYNILITSLFTGNHGNHRIHWVLFYSELTVIHVYVHKLCMCYCVYRFYCYSNSQSHSFISTHSIPHFDTQSAFTSSGYNILQWNPA